MCDISMLQVPLDERVRLLSEKPRSPSVDNIWKYADAFVNKDYFIDIMSSLDPHPRPLPPDDAEQSTVSTV
jgi:hypothetical protein